VAEWLKALPKPVGLMACIDERSQQVAEACKSVGIGIPDPLALVGVDNDEMICTLSTIPLSSVALTAESAGYEAARILDEMMQGHKPRRQQIVIRPSHVAARTSTDVMAVEDPHVAKAARHIADCCRQTLYVNDIAKSVGLSRRVLEKRFRAHLNCSINDHIRQYRVRRIEELLAGSEMTISEIALFMGFPDAAHIARYFKRETGVNPAEYRRNRPASSVRGTVMEVTKKTGFKI
jgi:LacI family transcriptional regulator